MPDLVIIRTGKGRIHKAFEEDGRRLVDEACNLDDAPGEERVITFAELEHADPADLCRRCWPPKVEAGSDLVP